MNKPAHTAPGGHSRGQLAALWTTRAIGALALLVVGGIHLEQYKVAHFSVVPTIGPLFLANFVAATATGLVLLIPIRASAGPRRLLFDSAVALAGIGVSAGALIGLLISERTPLFGFMDAGYRLEIVIALAAESVATISLAAFLVCAHRRARRRRGAGPARRGPVSLGAAPTTSEA